MTVSLHDPIGIIEIFGEPIAVGGQESYVISQLAHMNRGELKFDLLTPYSCSNGQYEELIRSWGGEVYAFGIDFTPGQSRENIRRPLRRFFGSHQYEIAHIHSGSTSVLAICAEEAKRADVKAVLVHSHAPLVNEGVVQKINKFVCNKRMKNFVDCYCACSASAATSKYVADVMPRVRYLKNGIDLDTYQFKGDVRAGIRKRLDVAEGQIVIGHVGRMAFPKNQSFLIDVFAAYHEKNPNSALWMVGDGPDLRGVEEKARALGLLDCVKLLGSRANVGDYLQGMDAFAFPSVYEGLGLAYLEAAASGLPCLISETIANEMNDDIVRILNSDEEYVRYVSLENTEPWVRGLQELAGRRNEHATEFIRLAGYDADNTASRLKELYLEVVAEVGNGDMSKSSDVLVDATPGQVV